MAADGWLLGERGIPRGSAAGREEFRGQMEQRRWESAPAEWKTIRRGWYLGDQQFRKELLEQMQDRAGGYHSASEGRETDEGKSNRIVKEELKKLKCVKGN
jgi:hypothetical protein